MARKRDETPFRIEPCVLDSIPAELADLVSDLVATTRVLGARLHPMTAALP